MKVFIGCSSKDDIDKKYIEEASSICDYLAKNNYDLVYGSYNHSMMGVCYNIFNKHHREVIGVSLEKYRTNSEDKYIYVNTSFDRIKYIYRVSDIFLILPGGIGTLSEIFSILEEFKNDSNNKLLILYNYNNFFDEIINYLKIKKTEKFICDDILNRIKIIDNINSLKDVLK